MCMGLLLIVPASSQTQPKKKFIPVAKIIAGCMGALSAAYILNNIAKTASRRIANPDYQGPKTIGATFSQMALILRHNKVFFATIIAATGLSIFGIADGINDLRQNSSEK